MVKTAGNRLADNDRGTAEMTSQRIRERRRRQESADGGVVPQGIRVATEWSWRLLVIAAAVLAFGYLLAQLRSIVIPVALAILLTALAIPATDRLQRWGVHRGLAAAATLIGLLVVVSGLFTLVGQQIAAGFSDLSNQVSAGIEKIHDWLVDGPLQLTDEQITSYMDQAQDWLSENREAFTQGALQAGSTFGTVVAGLFIALFALLFFLYQGGEIWAWVVRLFPRAARDRADGAGRAAWRSLTSFVRATVMVAFVDAVGITVVAVVLKVPLAVPIGVLVFLMSFIPVVGAVLSGAVAVLVALVSQGFVIAIVMLGGVLLVQQLESNVLQPWLMGRLVRLHPLAILLAIATGSFLAGIIGALFAVPLAATLNAAISYLVGELDDTDEDDDRRTRRPGFLRRLLARFRRKPAPATE